MVVHAGQCLCGAITYEVDGPLEPAGACHCEDCRRVSGTAFGVSFRVSREHLRISGTPARFEKSADSGAILTRSFCRDCGSPLFTESATHADAIYVKAGSLDDPAAITIDREIWTISRVNWSEIPASVKSYERGR